MLIFKDPGHQAKKRVKKFIPTFYGLLAGVLVGIYLLCQPAEGIPSFFWYRVEHVSVALHRFLMPASDPVNADRFFAPVCILFCATAGALVGFGIGAILKVMRRHGL